jgi:peptidoglycan hydrolase-like protein with peptidoglycan-binding domain/predicted small secreted protein
MTRYGVAILPVLALLAGCNTVSGVGKDLGAAKEAVVGGPSQPTQTAQGSATSKTQSSASQTSSGSQQNSASTSGYWKNDESSYQGETNQKTAAGARAKHGASSASARSDDVKQVQTALQTQGLYHGPIDGIYGPGTRNAVKKYQSQAGITQTGQLDQQTMQDLTRSGSGSAGKTTQ